MILEELRRNPPDVTLDHIVKDLLSFFNGFEYLHEDKRMIEMKCAIKREPEHKCWPEDKIKQAWEETRKEDIKSRRRKHWARVIMLQVVKSLVCDTCKQNTAQKNRHATTDEQGCDLRRNPEDGSFQSKAEPETVGAAGGHEQMSGEGKKVSIVSKITEESGATLESQLSAFSKDEAQSPAEVNSNKSETMNSALVNENEDTLVKNCEQQKYIDYCELPAADVHDKENVRLKNGLWSTVKEACGKAQRMKKNSEDRPAQSSAANRNQGQTGSVSQGQTGTPSQPRRKFSGNDPGDLDNQSGADSSEASETETGVKRRKDGTIYIRIPLSKVNTESASTSLKAAKKVISKYTLIDLLPGGDTSNKIKKKGFYVMSYNNEKKNAKWVYEILNLNTLHSYYKTPEFKDSGSDSDSDLNDPSYKPSKSSDPFTNKDYERGHLAAAANHTWCQEAYEETFWMSNITPQNKNLNRGRWKKLEEYCRKKILNDKVHNVHVYTGPLYQNDNLRRLGGKAVPSHFFKVIIVENKDGEVKLECYKMPNEKNKIKKKVTKISKKIKNNKKSKAPKDKWLQKYNVDINEIERLSGLKFTEECNKLTEVDHTRTATWTGNKGEKSVKIAVTISSYEKNEE